MSAERFFDDLARILAEPMPRRRAARVISLSLAAVVVPGVAGPARAATFGPRQRSLDPPRKCIQAGTGAGGHACCSKGPYIDGTSDWVICGYPAQRYDCLGADGLTCVDRCQIIARGLPPGSDRRVVPTSSAAKQANGAPERFECCIVPDFIPRDGECLANCELIHGRGAHQCGHGCCPPGTACCDRVFTRKAPHCCDPEEAEKEPWKDGEVASMIVAVALGVAGAATGGLALAILLGFGAGWGLVGVYAKIAGDDPPDPRYKELFRPRVPRVASVATGHGISPAAARALDRVIANRLHAGAYGLAWIRSIEKAQGAEKARDKSWAKRQRKAAAGYAREAAKALERDKSLSTVALRELERGGFVDTEVTLAQARQWQQRVRQQGLPVDITRALRSAGVDDARIAAFRTSLSRLDPNLVVGVGVFGNVTDRRLAAANAAMVKALRQAGRA